MKTETILKQKYKLSGEPVFTFSLPGGDSSLCIPPVTPVIRSAAAPYQNASDNYKACLQCRLDAVADFLLLEEANSRFQTSASTMALSQSFPLTSLHFRDSSVRSLSSSASSRTRGASIFAFSSARRFARRDQNSLNSKPTVHFTRRVHIRCQYKAISAARPVATGHSGPVPPNFCCTLNIFY